MNEASLSPVVTIDGITPVGCTTGWAMVGRGPPGGPLQNSSSERCSVGVSAGMVDATTSGSTVVGVVGSWLRMPGAIVNGSAAPRRGAASCTPMSSTRVSSDADIVA